MISLNFDNILFLFIFKKIKRKILHVSFLRVVFIRWIYKCTLLVELKESVNDRNGQSFEKLNKDVIPRRNKIFKMLLSKLRRVIKPKKFILLFITCNCCNRLISRATIAESIFTRKFWTSQFLSAFSNSTWQINVDNFVNRIYFSQISFTA